MEKAPIRVLAMINVVDVIAKAVKQYSEPVPLHGGGKSLWVFDALELGPQFPSLMMALNPQYQLAGIELGGELLAQVHSPWAGIVRKEVNGGHVYMPETPTWFPPHRVSLVDDVVTSGKSLEAAELALNMAGYEVVERICILDRRPTSKRDLKIRALVTAEDLGFSTSEPPDISSYLY